VIKAPPDNPLDPVKAIVRVNGAQNTTLLAFTITGPGSGVCNTLRYGVRVDAGGSANIYGNHITDIRDNQPPPLVSGCQNGVAVLVGRWFEGTTGSANIVGNVIDNYQKNGPTVDNAGSNAYIAANRILGVGNTSTNAQNGMQISRGATARVEHNFVAQNIYANPLNLVDQATGILLYNPGNTDISRNTAPRNDNAISDVFDPTAPVPNPSTANVWQNRLQTSTFDGIGVESASNHAFVDNDSGQNSSAGIRLYKGTSPGQGPALSNRIDNNRFDRNKGSGIFLENGQTNTVRGNHVRSNGTTGGDTTDGIRVSAVSTNNTINSNFMRGNVTHDCHDDSHGLGTLGTANTWLNNLGDTSQPAGLCRPGTDTEDRNDQNQSMQVSMAAGWNPNYPWQTVEPLATQYDWPAVYSTVDTQSVLQLLAQLAISAGQRHLVASD
jgi:parallel beta-helix repeat protein